MENSSSSSSSSSSGLASFDNIADAVDTKPSYYSKYPAMNDPKVQQTITKLRTKLRAVSRQTGDIRTDVYRYLVLPHLDRYAKNHPNIAQLRQGNTSKSGRTYPSSQYGWLANKITTFTVDSIIQSNKDNIVSPDIRSTRKYDANNMASFKRVFAMFIRRWWAINKDRLLPTYDAKMDNLLQLPQVMTLFNQAIQAKANNLSVPSWLRNPRLSLPSSSPHLNTNAPPFQPSS